MDPVFIGLIVVVVLILFYVIKAFNMLVRLQNLVADQWAQIDVLLKRRTDLIPNIVETVKGYAGHEKETLEAVISARNKAVSSTTPEGEIEANGELTKALGRLFALTEAYPDLKANTNFMNLQNNLKETEDKISYARQFYNDAVLKYKNKLEMFPTNIIASMFNFKPKQFFEITSEEKEVPQVKF